MNKIKSFVTKLLKGYFNDQDKKELIDILTTSLEEKVDDLVEQGTPREEAIEKSIQEFGDTEDVLNVFPEVQKNKELIKKRRNQLLFSTIGYIIVVSLAIFVNFSFLQFFANILWFYAVLIALLFWPLSMLYRYLSVKK